MPNMKFDFQDTSEPPDLEEFKCTLVKRLLKSAFWQNEQPEDVNMLKLPIIMAPVMMKKQVNNDITKDSLLDKSITHTAETLREFVQLIDDQGNASCKAICWYIYNLPSFVILGV